MSEEEVLSRGWVNAVYPVERLHPRNPKLPLGVRIDVLDKTSIEAPKRLTLVTTRGIMCIVASLDIRCTWE